MPMSTEEKTARSEARKEARKEAKAAAKLNAEKGQKEVATMTITIEWKKSRTWGRIPHAQASIRYSDGTYERSDVATASGCGYCKASTVIAELADQYLRGMVHRLPESAVLPYGVTRSPQGVHFSGGVGVSCYTAIAETLGGQWEHVAWADSFDVYRLTVDHA